MRLNSLNFFHCFFPLFLFLLFRASAINCIRLCVNSQYSVIEINNQFANRSAGIDFIELYFCHALCIKDIWH